MERRIRISASHDLLHEYVSPVRHRFDGFKPMLTSNYMIGMLLCRAGRRRIGGCGCGVGVADSDCALDREYGGLCGWVEQVFCDERHVVEIVLSTSYPASVRLLRWHEIFPMFAGLRWCLWRMSGRDDKYPRDGLAPQTCSGDWSNVWKSGRTIWRTWDLCKYFNGTSLIDKLLVVKSHWNRGPCNTLPSSPNSVMISYHSCAISEHW